MTVKSERLIIGSSNVYNFYRREDFSEYPEYHILKCTKSYAFKAQMNILEKENKLIVVSVIENFLADAARKGESDDPDNYVEIEKKLRANHEILTYLHEYNAKIKIQKDKIAYLVP